MKVRPQEMKSKDYRILAQAILSQWLPLAPATFRACVEVIPPPSQAQAVRIPKMLHPDLPYHQLVVQPQSKLEEDLYTGSTEDDAYIVAYISKMFAVPTNALPQNQRKPLTAEEMRQRGRANREAAAALAATGAVVVDQGKAIEVDPTSFTAQQEGKDAKQEESVKVEDQESLLGFARLYSGTMKAGQTLYAILPKYNAALPPSHPRNSKFITPVKIEHLYMMMGRELVMVNEVPAGNVFAVSGLEGKILRNGTLCGLSSGVAQAEHAKMDQDKACFVNLAGLHLNVGACMPILIKRAGADNGDQIAQQSAPIVRVALEPKEPGESSRR